jgi:hypothetical protein
MVLQSKSIGPLVLRLAARSSCQGATVVRRDRSPKETVMARRKRGILARFGPAVAAVVLLALALVADGGQLPAAAAGYTFRTLDFPASDAVTQVVWMNNAGLITMQYQQPPDSDFGKNQHTAILQNGTWTVIDVPGAQSTGGTNANQSGQVALSYWSEGKPWQVMIYQAGTMTPASEVPGYPSIIPGAINDQGVMTGLTGDDRGAHGFVGTLPQLRLLDYPGADGGYTNGQGINNAGIVVGSYLLADNTYHAFRLDGSTFSNIDVPGEARHNIAAAINNNGEIVGYYYGPRGFLLRNGAYTSIDVPGAWATVPYWINDLAQISGIYYDANGAWHGFIATPAPD